MNRNGFFRTKSFRYGSTATAFTAAFIAVVVVFNIIFTALANRYMWYIDMTNEEVFTLSEATKELLSDVDEEINIYFASEPDVLMQGDTSMYSRFVYNTALQLETEFDNIHVICKDIVKNRSFFERFRTNTATQIYTTSVIVESGEEVQVYALQSFFTTEPEDGTVWAYSGERKFVSAILQLTSAELPIVYFTSEHGESIGDSAAELFHLFTENGFDVRTINLAKEEIDEDARIVIINNPRFDFIGSEADDESSNEIRKLDRFLDKFGCLMVFADPDHADRLNNLSEFLEEWGVGFTPDTVIRDTEHSISTDGLSVVAKYDTTTLGSSIYKDLTRNLDTLPKTISRYSMPLQILWEEGGSVSGSRDVSTILTTYDTAETIYDGAVTEEGSFHLLTLSRESRIINNEEYYSFVVVSGSSAFADSKYLLSNAYANSDILTSTMKATGREKVLADIDFKVFDDTTLDITTAQANDWTVAMTVVLPVIAAVTGLVIWVRRKHA
ncbi:MAG: Gldg family protein [Clostridia bacterium]|nr:Gldg family protein [Clostridia bacterium]